MRLTSWLDSFALKARKSSARRARMSVSARRSRPAVCRLAAAEHLEDRTLLSVTPAATGVGTGTGSGSGAGSGSGSGSGAGGTTGGSGGSTSPTLIVSAGQNAATTVNATAILAGTVTYNDPSATQPLTTTWSMVSGPGSVTFEKPNALNSNVLFSTPGTYVLQLSATDGILSSQSQVNILVTPPTADAPPMVSAGANQTTTVGATLNLNGSVSDENPQTPLTITWSQISGPGIANAAFANPNVAATTATFSQAGTYVLNLVATDGTLASNSTVIVTVNPSTVNPAPVVSAGPNITVLQNSLVTLNGSASTSSGTLSTVWQVANAPGGTYFVNPNSPTTQAQFSTPGIYQIRLVASNGTYTNSSYTTITVNPSTTVASNFQQGTNGYTGASDSYISSASTNTNYSTSTTLNVRYSASEEALLEWNLSSLATTSTVTSATLTLDVTTAASGVTYNIYALTGPWTASQVTYTSSATGTKWPTLGATGTSSGSTAIGSFTASSTGLVTVTLNSTGVALVQSWIANPATNYGMIIRAASGTTQLSIASSKFATVADRPQLSISTVASTGATYSPPPITNPTTSANAAFMGFDGKRDGYMAPIGLDLDTLYFQYQQWQQNGSQGTFTSNNSLIILSGSNVLVNVTSSFNVSSLVTTLQSYGMQVTGVAGPDISGWMPINQLPNLATAGGLNFAQPASYYLATAPADSTQGSVAIGAAAAQSQFGVTGTGVTVGVISDSYNSLGGAATDVTNGQLPSNVYVLQDLPAGAGTDEGRAMLQIVHAEAPGANLAFATGDLGDASFAQNIEALQSQAGANVEVDDLGYFDEPFFQEGIISQAVDSVASKGVAYFSAAGNDGQGQAWQGAFVNSGQTGLFSGGTLNTFGTGANAQFQQVTIPVGSEVTLDFQWNQPFASAGGAGSASQMDIFLLDSPSLSALNLVGEGVNNSVGGDAIQLVSFFNDGSFGTSTFYIAIEHDSGP